MSRKRMVEIIGVLAALATLCAFFVALFQLLQSINAQAEGQKSQTELLSSFATSIANQKTAEANQGAVNSNLATQVALQEKQLGVQQTMATVQAKEPQSGPTATALAQTVSQLAKTSEAIEAQRRQVNATQTALMVPSPTRINPTSTTASSTFRDIAIDSLPVSAEVPRTAIGITLREGDRIRIENLNGEWTGDMPNNQPMNRGCGFYWNDVDPQHIYPIDPRQNAGAALIGYIDNVAFMIGCNVYDRPAFDNGVLYLGMNDCRGCFWDNKGTINVRVAVTRKR